MKIKINEDILIEFDRNNFSPKYKGMFTTIEEGQRIVHGSSELSKDDHRRISDQFPFWAMNRYHLYYRILGYFSTFYNGKILVDIGTRMGHSAASLAFNENNMVYTYNNVDERVKPFNLEPKNDVFNKMGNIKVFVESGENSSTPLGNILDSYIHRETILKSDLIFMDVDPHDGGKEEALFDFLYDNNYKGVTLWDDINVQLMDWFSGIDVTSISTGGRLDYKHVEKYNLEEYSWEGGTGVICFGEQELILE